MLWRNEMRSVGKDPNCLKATFTTLWHSRKLFMNNQQIHWIFISLFLLFCRSYMFRHIRVIIRELFRACWITCESKVMVDKTLCYKWLCVCYAEALAFTDLSGYVAKCVCINVKSLGKLLVQPFWGIKRHTRTALLKLCRHTLLCREQLVGV
jgi:hypothetical protein